MDFQIGFNIAVGLVAFLGGWIMNNLRDAMQALQLADKELVDKVQGIEVVVAGQYVKRDDFQDFSKAIFTKLDRIEDKMDGKADK